MECKPEVEPKPRPYVAGLMIVEPYGLTPMLEIPPMFETPPMLEIPPMVLKAGIPLIPVRLT
jgi:hypothetical protein